MRETDFIKQNKAKWEEFEFLLKQTDKNPDELTRLFIEITDDLSYSRTFYPNRLVGAYLNNIAQKIYKSVYSKRHENFRSKFKNFWVEEIPAIVYSCRIEFLISLVVFLFSVFIGVFSSMNDPEFANLILGNRYVNMTNANIENGDPMAVYKDANQVNMFLGITLNNLKVAFWTFISGVLMSIGSIAVLLQNGIMVGAFQYFFIERGLFVESFLTIWMHGTLEISAIIIAGAAGIALGKGLVFPGSYSRLYSFQLSAKKGIKIMLSITPIFIMAGFIEGFLTRYTDLPDMIRLGVILLSLFFIIGYYIYYPFMKAKSGFKIKKEKPINFGENNNKLKKGELKDNGQLFTDTFAVYRVFLRKTFSLFLPISIITGILIAFIITQGFTTQYGYINTNWAFNLIETIFDYKRFIYLVIINGSLVSAILFFSLNILTNSFGKAGKIDPRFGKENVFILLKAHFFKILFIAAVIMLMTSLGNLGYLLLLLTFPFILLWLFHCVEAKKSLVAGFNESLSLLGANLSKTIGLSVLLLIICGVFLFTLNSSLIWLLVEMLSWNLMLSEATTNYFYNAIFCTIVIYGLSITLPVIFIGIGILYHSLMELSTANSLKESIKSFGSTKKIYGFDTES